MRGAPKTDRRKQRQTSDDWPSVVLVLDGCEVIAAEWEPLGLDQLHCDMTLSFDADVPRAEHRSPKAGRPAR
jgi:hypothetical protein